MKTSIEELKKFLIEKNYVSPWITLNSFDWGSLTLNSKIKFVKKGNLLFHQGDFNKYIYIVKDGRLRIFFIDSLGNENCIYIAEKGSMIGEISLIDELPTYASAYAIIDSHLYQVSKEDFLDHISKNTQILNNVLKNMSKKVRLMNSEIEYFSKDATSRIAISLISLCVQYGKVVKSGIKINIRFTHEELANLTGLNRVTVSKIYVKFFNRKIISKENGYIIINDIECLKNLIS